MTSSAEPIQQPTGQLVIIPPVPQIYAAMTKVMGAVGHISKARRNTQQGYSFRGIDDIYHGLQGPMVEAGVFCVPQVMERAVVERETKNGGTLFYTTLTVKHTFYAADGSHVEAITVGEAMDSGDKSSNKAMSAAMKYAMIEVFCIPTEGDNDSENQTHELAQKKPTPPANPPQQNPSGAHRTVTKAGAPAAAATTAQAAATEPPAKPPRALSDELCAELSKLTSQAYATALWKEAATWPHREQLLGEAIDACKDIREGAGSDANAARIIDHTLALKSKGAMDTLLQLKRAALGEADAVAAASGPSINDLHAKGAL